MTDRNTAEVYTMMCSEKLTEIIDSVSSLTTRFIFWLSTQTPLFNGALYSSLRTSHITLQTAVSPD
jgi:hypothetical protein